MKKDFEKAKKYIKEFNKIQGIEINDVRLEEFEKSNLDIIITISYLVDNDNMLTKGGLLDFKFKRIYKTLFINKRIGEVEKIKNYNN